MTPKAPDAAQLFRDVKTLQGMMHRNEWSQANLAADVKTVFGTDAGSRVLAAMMTYCHFLDPIVGGAENMHMVEGQRSMITWVLTYMTSHANDDGSIVKLPNVPSGETTEEKRERSDFDVFDAMGDM
jgi:hypothetical protein